LTKELNSAINPNKSAELKAELASERDLEKRRRLYDEYLRQVAYTNDLREEKLERIKELSQKLGFQSYLDLYEKLNNINTKALQEQVQQFLEATEKVYTVNLQQRVRSELKLSTEELERADIDYFLNIRDFDHLFPGEGLASAYRETLENLGIKLFKQKNLFFEVVSSKKTKNFFSPIRIPEEIRIGLKSVGGLLNYEESFYMLGKAEHHAFISSNLRPEFKYTGDQGLVKFSGFLFSSLVTDPNWLEYMTNSQGSNQLQLLSTLRKLAILRHQAAKFCYEIALYGASSFSSLAMTYAELMSETTKFRHQKDDYLFDQSGLDSNNYIRAVLFEAALRDYLMTRYGHRWWKNIKAGNFLKEIWNTGYFYDLEELSKQIGLGSLSIDPLESQVLSILKS
ncbi:MAG: hypothetical protein JNN15_16545, partial [Blastocatellia bacterium]|nr:hypothetical protein [Blastocatellia bacterium]